MARWTPELWDRPFCWAIRSARRWGWGLFWWMAVLPLALGAVTSTGELNVLNDPSGAVPTSAKPTLILTLLVDRSQAEPGEEIKTIEIFLPPGFSMTEQDAREVRIDGQPVPYTIVMTPQSARFELADPIDNFLSSFIEILFDVQTPDLPTPSAEFRVAMRNLVDQQIGEFIKPGEIDGNPNNNNDYTLVVFQNVPPAPPRGATAVLAEPGENDVLLRWEPVPDPEVRGYLIYRDDRPAEPLDVPNGEVGSFRDVNVPAGLRRYSIAAYKSRLVVSEQVEAGSVLVGLDTRPPDPVAALVLTPLPQGVELRWPRSGSPDVVEYRLTRRRLGETEEEEIGRVPVDPQRPQNEYSFAYLKPLEIGRHLFSVTAVDEAGNVSEPKEAELAILDRPFPNPFTPLGEPPYNKVTFPARSVPEAEGPMTVRIFDLHGRLVRELFSDGGDLTWDGRDAHNALLPGGIYVYQIEVGGMFRIGTVVMIR
ncbi:MAG: hypothetical protein KatS3mg115_2223 [Candidatus Poribacteria bacterium]|nr:MAG: hypothetical protein KatS3mg115_2223 [Candidatus Poribacteria bacterium]